ncbi:MAG: glycosyltransferase family 4 protein [Candidatus Competibacteraceae bacterium]|nr:glycosyltransferase family 4 protein [Candidatus Competibacteraceae bacterium]
MERLNWHMAAELARQYTLTLIGPAGATAHSPPGVTVHEAPLRPLAYFMLIATWQSLRSAWAIKPAVVLAGSGLTAPLAWIAARFSRARAIAYVHGLDITVSHPVYRLLWLPFLRRMDRIIANSHATAQLAQCAGVRAERIVIVHPGVALPEPLSSAEQLRQRTDFRARHGLGEGPLLLSVGRLTTRKGLREFVVEVLPRIVAARLDTILAIVGETPAYALHAQSQTPESIQAAADAVGVGAHVRFLGAIHDMALASAYYAADVHVFPVRDIPNDPEGFGMVAIESAAHGLSTVAYATGGVVDAVRDGCSGDLIKPGDYQSMVNSIIKHLQGSSYTTIMACRTFAADFSWPKFGVALRQLCQNLITSSGKGGT